MLAAIRRSGAAWTRALLLQLLLAGPGGCLSRQELFPFGPGHGDLELEAGDDQVSPALELRRALRFFDKSDINSVYVSATRGGRWGPSGRRAWGPSRGRKEGRGWQGRPRGRTDVGVVGGDRDPLGAGARGAGRGAGSPGLPPPPGPQTSPRRLATVARGARGSGGLVPSARPRARPPDPGTPGGVSSPAAVGGIAAGKSVRVSLLSCSLGDGTRSGGTRAKARAGSQAARGPWDFRRCRVRKRPPNPASAPGI